MCENYRSCVRNLTSRLLQIAHKLEKQQWRHNVLIFHRQFFLAFLLSNLITGSSFKSTELLVLELWQFWFIRDWPKIRKSEIPPSESCSIFGNWGDLRVPNLARMSLIKSYLMLQNAKYKAFNISKLLRKNQQGG